MTANPGQFTFSTNHNLTMSGTRDVFVDFEDMVWLPTKRLLKKMMGMGSE